MRLKPASKAIVMKNIDLLKYCNKIGIDQEKFRKCNIERMGTNFVFVLSKEGAEKYKGTFLEHDIDTQPDIVLIMKVSEDGGKIEFEETSQTTRILIT